MSVLAIAKYRRYSLHGISKDNIENVSHLELQNYLITTLDYSPLQMLKFFYDTENY